MRIMACLGVVVLVGLLVGCKGMMPSRVGAASRVQSGMDYTQVRQIMGQSWDTAGGFDTESWSYGLNILGFYTPSCSSSVRRGTALLCTTVYFYRGKVVDVVSY